MPKKNKETLSKSELASIKAIMKLVNELNFAISQAKYDKKIPNLRQFWLAEEKLEECGYWAIRGIEEQSKIRKRK